MSYNTKNYTEQGGDKTVIGGTLEIKEGASVTGLTPTATPASEMALGGVKASPAGGGDTVEVKIGENAKLYVPVYPTDATESVSGLVKVSAHQADSIAEDTATLVADFNALLAKLKAAGLMADQE